MTVNYRVNLGFTKLSDADLLTFTTGVIAGLTNNPLFNAPPVDDVALTGLQITFTNKVAAAAQGGPVAKSERDTAREALLGALRADAAYVQMKTTQDLTGLLTSGFLPNSTSRAKLPLDTPTIMGLDNSQSAQLIARVTTVNNSRAYEVQVKNGTGGWNPAGIFTQSRAIVIDGLVPGSTYSVQVRAIGGSTGYSNWSDPVSRMAT